MEAKEKAKELIHVFKKHVNGYVGSSMLANLEFPEQILYKAKECALITVNEVIKNISGTSGWAVSEMSYWSQVKKEIEQYEI